MKNHKDEKQVAPAKLHPVLSQKEQKLALALRRNLERRKTAVRGGETGADS